MKMYKCGYCNHLNYQDIKCEECAIGGGIEELLDANGCSYCGNFFTDDDDVHMFGEICEDCAIAALTVELWDEWVRSHDDLPKYFYVEYFFQSDVTTVSSDLIEVCRNEWDKWKSQTHKNPIDTILDFCETSDYLESWAKWYIGRNP
jgi:hypothetical protein